MRQDAGRRLPEHAAALNTPKPALVSARAAERLPRLALLLFCAAYVLPGLFGRDPWRGPELAAFGAMASVARGDSPWWAPTLGGLPADAAPLATGLGALAMKLLGGWMDPALAARLPFALLLIGVLACTWYACYLLARTEAAQPVPFAFGGEAHPIDYARAVADGALLALVASLGLLQPGHETTPELVQLFALSLFLYAMAASGWRQAPARVAALLALPLLAGSGAPVMALALALGGILICRRSSYPLARAFAPWLAGAGLGAALTAWALGSWALRLKLPGSPLNLLELPLWFLWPSWVLAGWTLWQWRRHAGHRHIAVPAGIAGVLMLGWLAGGGSDRALLLMLPATAVLAAFALPTLSRSLSAAIDWFSVFAFSLCALASWMMWISLSTGWPAKPAANVLKLAPGYVHTLSPLAVAAAVAGTLAWLTLVRWRTGRHRSALWKSLVLPAGGVALNWLLLMTLLLPVLDYARSQRPLVERLAQHLPAGSCVLAPGEDRSTLAALSHHGGWRVEARPGQEPAGCDWLITSIRRRSDEAGTQRLGWSLVAQVKRPTDRSGSTLLYRRVAPTVATSQP